jgi:hypothetical protein
VILPPVSPLLDAVLLLIAPIAVPQERGWAHMVISDNFHLIDLGPPFGPVRPCVRPL